MAERILCLDTSIYLKHLAPDERSTAATALVSMAAHDDVRLVAPAWAWAEVGTALRKKVRQRLLLPNDAAGLWSDFEDLPIEFVDSPILRRRTWELAHQYEFLTLYDAAFLACTETVLAPVDAEREFWTADEAFLRSLGTPLPPYVRRLMP